MPGDVYHLKDDQLTVLARAEWVQIDQARFDELRAQRKAFLAAGSTIERSAVIDPHADDMLRWTQVDHELNLMGRFMLMNQLGQDVVEAASRGLNPFVFRVVDEAPAGSTRTYEFSAVDSSFVPSPDLDDVDQDALCEKFEYGVVIALADLLALIDGRIQIWDLAGVAVDAWFAKQRLFGPLPLMYTWWGEQTVPTDYEAILQRQLEVVLSGKGR
jgi:hypothetical protein